MVSRSALGMFGALTLAAGLACTAQATFFSFASDVNGLAPTFAGTAGGTGATSGQFLITDFSRPNTHALMIDDNNGPLPTIMIPVEFHASLTASAGSSVQVAGTFYNHTYRVTGTFGFFDPMGNALLLAQVGPSNAGLLTVPGTQTAWASSGAVLGADSFADVTYTATAALITRLGGTATAAQYGVFLGSSVNPDDFGFTLTAMNIGNIGASVQIDSLTKAPTSTWRAESSYSGSAAFPIPNPGTAALASIAGMLILGRRRRA